ncbi:MAG: putative Fe-S cluster assembly protein SufT [Gammaproteobacteria bacterium]|nr:putative Fe-S cluster assembly protein SufT [Gammaproteobacteria bacterium]
MHRQTTIEVKRDVEAVLIPTGVKVTLVQGTQVHVTQALGNAYTLYVNGNLVRLAGSEGDAIGLVVLTEPDVDEMEGSLEDKVWAHLRTCFDPEIPVNIVDLGLVYQCEVTQVEKGNHDILIQMTLTAPGCGMGPVLVQEIEEKIKRLDTVNTVQIDLVFDPPWDRDRMTDEAKLQLGLL